APPTISPSSGTYTTPVTVTLTAEAGAGIRYTLDGSTPVDLSPLYSSPVVVNQPAVIKAKAFRRDYTTSAEASTTLAFQAVAPTMAPPAGTYTTAQVVTMSTPNTGAIIRYTLDGSDPTAASLAYAAGIQVSANTTVTARAFVAGWQ